MSSVEDRWFAEAEDGGGKKTKTPLARHGVGQRWRARWRDPAGNHRTRSFARKGDAERFLTTIESAKLNGSYVDPNAGKLTVGDWSKRWLATQGHLKPSTKARYDGIVSKQIKPKWSSTPLAQVKHSDVTGWISDLSAGPLAAATVRYVHRVFALMLDAAVNDGLLYRNPATGIRLPRAAKSEKRFLTAQQVDDLADAAGDARLVILTLSYAGIRWGELAALRAGRVDTLRRRLEIAEAVTEVRGHLEWGTPKSHQCRSVPIPRFLADDLVTLTAGKAPDDLVFTGLRGGVLRNLNFRRDHFDAAATAAGLDGLTPHELRHTAASLAVASGANVKAVQRMLGHASAAMTLDVYSGLFDDDLDGVADRMDAVGRAAAVSPSRPMAEIVDLATVRQKARGQ
jgi:integrase